MGIKVIVKIDFKEDATTEQRSIFNSVMRKDDWTRSSASPNCWEATFLDGVTEGGALNVIRHDVDRASKKSKMYKYTFMVQVDEDVLGPFDNFKPPAKK